MSEAIKCDRNVSKREKVLVDFGFCDDKGRKLGVMVSRYTVTYTPATEKWGTVKVPGSVELCADVQATRGGERFGASNRDGEFATEEQREAWISQRIEATRTRYEAKYNK